MRNKLSLIFLLCGGLLIVISATFMSVKSAKTEKNTTSKEASEKKTKNTESPYMPMVYIIEDEDSKVYLIPSMALGKSNISNVDSKLIKLIDDKELVVEYNFTELDQLDYIKKFILNEEDYLYNYLNDDLNSRLVEFSNSHTKYSYDDYIHYNIGFNYKVIDNLIYYEAGLTTDGLMDVLIGEKVKMEHNKVSILETEDDRATYINSPSHESFVGPIDNLITNFDSIKEQYLKNYTNYVNGNVDELEKYYNTLDMNNGYYKAKILDKNEEFKIDVDDYLANNKEAVIVFDIENVYGDNGLLKILKEKYTVTEM